MAGIKLHTAELWKKTLDPEDCWMDLCKDTAGQIVLKIMCRLCEKHVKRLKAYKNFSKAFIEGISGTALKKDNLVKHLQSQQHKNAQAIEEGPKSLVEIYATTSIGKSVVASQTIERKRVEKLIDVVYTMAKEAIPFTKFSALTRIEKRHGVELGDTYCNDKACKEFTMCVADHLRNELRAELQKAQYFSILTDGSEDTGTVEKELIYIIYINEIGLLKARFFRLKNVRDGTAPGLKSLIEEAFTEFGILDYKQRLVGFGADGAAVNMGSNRGLAALFRLEIPWLVSFHCLNHRLELAVRDAFAKTFFDDISSQLMSLYQFYKRSPKRLRELRALGKVMKEAVIKPHRAHGTRWVQHKLHASQSLLRSYNVIVNHLESMTSDSSQDQAKAKGILSALISFKFIIHLLFFVEMLKPLSRLSLAWQKSSLELTEALDALQTLNQCLSNMETRDILAPTGSDLAILLQDCEKNDRVPLKFKDIKLTNVPMGLQYFNNHKIIYIQKISKCIRDRFNLGENKIYESASKILDTRQWPYESQEQLSNFGTSEISSLSEHFIQLLKDSSFYKDTALSEWQEFKVTVSQSNMRQQIPDDVWSKLICHHCQRFPNLTMVIKIIRVLPLSNSIVERCFSTMNKVKSDWRSSLGEDTLEALVRIKKDGPPPEKYDTDQAVDIFFAKKPRHANVQPYGSRKGSSSESDLENFDQPQPKKIKI